MNNSYDSYEFQAVSGEEDSLYQEILEMEDNSRWMPGVTSKDIQVLGLEDAPIFNDIASEDGMPMVTIKEAVRYGMEEELVQETLSRGMGLIISTGHSYGLMRDTAYSSLCETAKINGAALGRLYEKNKFEFSELMNLALSVAKGTSLLLERYGKISALHSNADGGYDVMPISKLFEITALALESRFGKTDFRKGYNSHGYTAALWELPEAQDRLLKMYQDALHNYDSQYAINFMPAVRFASSDTATSCAVLEPQFIMDSGAGVSFVEPVKVKHSKRGSGTREKSPIEVFEEEANSLWAKFEESAEVIQRLSEIVICNPGNCVVSLCKRFKIPKKYGECARREVERLRTIGGYLTAHDLYLAMTEIVAEAMRCDAKETVITNLNESVAKILKADWGEHDVGGIVAWGNAA